MLKRKGNSKVIESPAGLVDKGETIIEAGKRELMEETGYEGMGWCSLYENVPNSAGLTNETTNKLLALNCIKKGKGGGIEYEDIKIHLVDIIKVPQFLKKKEKEGCMYDPKILTGLYLYFYGDLEHFARRLMEEKDEKQL